LTNLVAPDFRGVIADCIDASHDVLAERWLDELARSVSPHDSVFPGTRPLGCTPEMIAQLAAFFRMPHEEPLVAQPEVAACAREIGELRHAQRASVDQIVREYRALRTVVMRFIEGELGRLRLEPCAADVVDLMFRLDAGIDVLLESTVETFVAEYAGAVTKHADRLERFNRVLSHELRQPLGIFQFAVKLLRIEPTWANANKRQHVLATIERNVQRMSETLEQAVALSRSEHQPDGERLQHVDLTALASRLVERVRDLADSRGVSVRVADGLPTLVVDASRLELALDNLVSNAIKYSDPGKAERFVEISALADPRASVCLIVVRDNGIGIDESDLQSIFARFYRSRPERDAELGTSGVGLGLSIVADCVDALNGDIRVDSTVGEGSTFIVELPQADELPSK
jgi:signal transduction histidine kinase